MKPIDVLAIGRIAAGASAFLLPKLAGSLAGVGGPPEAHLGARLFGGRDLAIGAATLAFTGERRAGAVTLGVAVDALDVVAAGLGIRQGSLSAVRALPLIGLAAGAVAIGAQELRG